MGLQGFAGSLPGGRAIDEIVAGDRIAIETDVEHSTVLLRGVVMRALPDTLWIALSAPDPRVAQMRTGQPVSLTFSRRGAAVVATSAFINAVRTEPERVFAVERPVSTQAVQRRQYLRADVQRTVTVLLVNDRPLRTARAEALTLNLGAGGLLFETGMELCVGDKARLAIELAAGDTVTLDALILRIDDPRSRPAPGLGAAGTELRCRVAVRFLEPSIADQNRISRHILGLQRTRRDSDRKAVAERR